MSEVQLKRCRRGLRRSVKGLAEDCAHGRAGARENLSVRAFGNRCARRTGPRRRPDASPRRSGEARMPKGGDLLMPRNVRRARCTRRRSCLHQDRHPARSSIGCGA